MHHLAAEEAAAQLAAHAQAPALGIGLLLRAIEIEEAHHQRLALVVDQPNDELAPRTVLDAAFGDAAFDLHRLAVVRRGQAVEPRLVLVAQRQVQREVDVAHQAELAQGPLRGRQLAWGRFRHGLDCGVSIMCQCPCVPSLP